MLVQPRSTGGNFEYVAIPRQGMLILAGALKQWSERPAAPFYYECEVWFEDKLGRIDPDSDLQGVDILMLSSLVNETPRAYEIGLKAKIAHGDKIVILGGGPQMGPLPEEAILRGGVEVVAQREAEDIIGPLCDVLMDSSRSLRANNLRTLNGIAFTDDLGQVVTIPTDRRRNLLDPDFVLLPDFRAVKGLSKKNPWAAGVLETSRGCTESCSYCEVIKQFVIYKMIKPETEIARIWQLIELADEGLIYQSPRDGRVATFISDDLHSPPKRAVLYHNKRLARARAWRDTFKAAGIDLAQKFFFISQNRAELGSDPKLAEAFREIGMGMLYLGVESSSAENLAAVKKRQEPDQMHRDLETLNKLFQVVAMTIIGLPYDDEAAVDRLAEWVRGVSRFQTANLLTPLPATDMWPKFEDGKHVGGLRLINAHGELLNGDGHYDPLGELPPYHLFTGRQFVHHDDAVVGGTPRNWTLERSRAVMDHYLSLLRPVDKLYERILGMIKRQAQLQHADIAVPTRVA